MFFKLILRGIITLVIHLIMVGVLPGQTSTLEYQATSAVISNPERGWYDDYYSHSGGSNLGTNYRSLSISELTENRENDKITLILRLFYLHEFLEQDEVSSEYLAKMQADFDVIRSAGVKCIVRFAYSASQRADVWDATPDKVFSHIESLRDVLATNGDVIAGVQAGFIGAWGEWYYTKNFAGPGYIPDETDQQNRITLVESLLDILPGHVTVQGRTPAIMKNLTKTDDPITEAEAFDGSFKSRIGHHNDCFLANASDYGTYTNLEEDLAYLHETSKYTITGGETCDASNQYSDCVNGVPRMVELHWTYLNRDYNQDVYDKWIDQGCYQEINLSMGYRIRLLSATLADSADPGASMDLAFELSNEGYAAPTQYKPIQIVLTHTVSGDQTILDYTGTHDDIRHWLPGDILLEGSVAVPADLSDGNYHMSLRFPDKSPVLATNPAYSIQLANVGTWDSGNGINQLYHLLSVGSGGEGKLPLTPSSLSGTTVSETQVDLSWTDNSDDETGFEITRAEGDGFDWEQVLITDPDTENYSDSALRKGVRYHYMIRAINSYGSSQWSDSISINTLGVTVGENQIQFITLSPNPLTNSDLTIYFADNAEKRIVISDLSGARLFEVVSNQPEIRINREIFHPGLFLVTLFQHNETWNSKLIVL